MCFKELARCRHLKSLRRRYWGLLIYLSICVILVALEGLSVLDRMLGANFIRLAVMILVLYFGKPTIHVVRQGLNEKIRGGCWRKTIWHASTTELHEVSILGDFNIIAGGFTGGGQTSSTKKRYVRSIMTTTKIERPKKDPDIVFSSEDLKGVVPHEDDLIVVSVVTMGRNVHRVLVDQGSLIDVMFWNTFIGVQIPMDHLQPFDGVLVGFSGD